ncbi:MAG: L-rhamnose isomerase, partial [Spirochaetaceae bacterium]|nr:L-rhamnose isomerase [Spirochaetaceae bacterium]
MKEEIGTDKIESAYEIAKEAYAALGVSTGKAITDALALPVSVHCWQGDDVLGFENSGPLSGGILTTGNYPGRARSGDELRADAEFAFTLIPGAKRFNLHSIYAEPEGKTVSRDKLEPEHFTKWMAWSKNKKIPLDFNTSYFSH